MKWVLILIAPLILLSGCVSQVQTGNGVVIKEFRSDFSTVYSGEAVSFYVTVQNIGSFDASDVWIELLGLDPEFCCEQAGAGPWVSGEKLPNEPECRYTEGHFSLRAPNTFWGVPGEKRDVHGRTRYLSLVQDFRECTM